MIVCTLNQDLNGRMSKQFSWLGKSSAIAIFSAHVLAAKASTLVVPQANASVAHMEIRQAALRMIGLAVFENIAHTSQRSNHGPAPIRVYLSP